MLCDICKKQFNEGELYQGVLEDSVVKVCNFCAESENIPIIKKPTSEQLKNADKSYSVRERMERMAGIRNVTDISSDQNTVQRNLSRLRIPDKKQINNEVIYDYNWQIKIARRRKKMTPLQLANQTGIDLKTIESIEQGKLPKNFREILPRLENLFGIKLLKDSHVKPRPDERKILEEVGMRMGHKPKQPYEEENKSEPEVKSISKEILERHDKIRGEQIDFHERAELQNVNLSDLVDMKREKAKRENKYAKKDFEDQKKEIIDDDIEIDEEEDWDLERV